MHVRDNAFGRCVFREGDDPVRPAARCPEGL